MLPARNGESAGVGLKAFSESLFVHWPLGVAAVQEEKKKKKKKKKKEKRKRKRKRKRKKKKKG